MVASDSDVVLASLNSHGGRSADGVPFDLAAACRSFAADVITLQECWHSAGQPDPLAAVAAELDAQLLRADLLTDTDLRRLRISSETGRGRWGLALLTRLPVLASEVTELGQAWGDVTPRAAQLVTLAVPGGGKLRVVNTHLTHVLTSPVQLVRLLRRLLPSRTPTVIAGDLNMPAPLAGLAAGYRPAVAGKTYPASRPLLQLDHVLAGPGVVGCGGEVLPAAGSDHLPIRARLRLDRGT
ncbi:MAG TPA: endonuclease/exonuclease/phosphatase family protein [Streptosporangiaceae bacterium]|jgi:endonuclease/exonuclease/phosphatase family metal-dependent hydrolase